LTNWYDFISGILILLIITKSRHTRCNTTRVTPKTEYLTSITIRSKKVYDRLRWKKKYLFAGSHEAAIRSAIL